VQIDGAEIIGARLRALREALGYKRARAFCEVVGITEQAWNNYECGRRRISLDEAMKVVARTGASLDWIYRGLEHTLPVNVAEKLRLNLAAADRGTERDWLDINPSKKV
jgi:transcriptional regulator with XRE-family HTH domain